MAQDNKSELKNPIFVLGIASPFLELFFIVEDIPFFCL